MSSKGPVTLLMNDRAGKFKNTASAEEMQKMVNVLGFTLRVVGTKSAQEMSARLRELVAQGAERVAVAGGDGTMSLAVQELAGKDTALAIIAQGTANNFATALRLPQDLPSALRVVEEGEIQAVDLGRVGGKRYFTESSGVGIFANALAIYGRSNKNFLRGLYAMAKIIFSFRASRVTMTLDGMKWQEPCVLCEVANTYRMGRGIAIAPGAKVTDGLLDVVTLGNLTRGEILPYYRSVQAQMHLTLPKAHSHQAKEIVIEARRKLPVHADDRVVGATPITINVEPGALKVLVERL